MKIQLVSGVPAEKRTGGEIDAIYPPLGLLYLASYSRKHIPDLDFKITDGNLVGFEKTLKEIEKFQPNILGFSITSFGIVGAYKLINDIKNGYPDIFVVAGGPHPTALPDEVFRRTKTDVVALGEGERTFVELINNFKSGKLKDVKGIAFINGKKVVVTKPRMAIRNIDLIPFPARELIDIKKYPGYVVTKGNPETYYISSRGCPYQCLFCANGIWNHQTPKVRFRSPKNVLDEVEILVNKYKMKDLYDQCDEFNTNLSWAEGICDEFIKRDLDVTWKVQMRADKVTERLATKLEKSGCWLVNLGIETGNQETLNGVKKFINLNQVAKSCQILKNHGIKVFGLFMAFNVWEDNGKLRYEDVNETRNSLKFAKSLIDKNLLDYISWSLTAPFPGSKLYEIGLKHDLIPQEFIDGKEDWNNTWRLLLNLPGVSREDWETLKKEGSKLQVRCLLKNGNMNKSLIPLYLKRGIKISKLELEKLLGKFSLTNENSI